MKRWVWLGGLTISTMMVPGVLLAAGSKAAAPGTTSGVWDVDGNVMGQPVRMVCTITETERKVGGSCSAAADNFTPHKIAGTVKGQAVELHFESEVQGTPISVILTGTLNTDGTKLSGELDVEPMSASGMFVATRQGSAVSVPGPRAGSGAPARAGVASAPAGSPAQAGGPAQAGSPAQAAPPPPAPAPAAPIGPVTGTWKINGDVQGTPVVMTCVLAEAEHTLTGKCTGAAGDTKPRVIEGTTTATTASWDFDSEYQGQPISVFLVGKPNADRTAMQGTIAVAPMNVDGTFDAVKQ